MQLEKEGMRVSASTVRRALIEKKCVWKRPKLRAPGSVKKDYRKRKIVENYKSIAPALRSRGVGVFFEDEKWIELLARLESVWMRKGTEMFVPTPGYAARWNFFISLDYATGSIVWNSSPPAEERGVQETPVRRRCILQKEEAEEGNTVHRQGILPRHGRGAEIP